MKHVCCPKVAAVVEKPEILTRGGRTGNASRSTGLGGGASLPPCGFDLDHVSETVTVYLITSSYESAAVNLWPARAMLPHGWEVASSTSFIDFHLAYCRAPSRTVSALLAPEHTLAFLLWHAWGASSNKVREDADK